MLLFTGLYEFLSSKKRRIWITKQLMVLTGVRNMEKETIWKSIRLKIGKKRNSCWFEGS